MKARLFQFHTSPFCAKVRKILDYKGVDYEIVEVDYLDARSYWPHRARSWSPR